MNTSANKHLPFILIGLAQGLALYLLNRFASGNIWPFTKLAVFLPLLTVCVLLPATFHLFIEYLKNKSSLRFYVTISIVLALLGAYTGWAGDPGDISRSNAGVTLFAFGCTVFAGWFVCLPFAQIWLKTGNRSFPYTELFYYAWRNTLLLLDAAVFTGVFWALLGIWSALFSMLGIDFFAKLFSSPFFAYHATSSIFGWAIGLSMWRENIITTMRQQMLTFFTWLTPLAVVISILFLSVLPFTGLTPIWKTGYATPLMLTLQFVLIIFVNTAFQDGASEPPFSKWFRKVLDLSLLLLPVYSILCIYSLYFRVNQYGWSVDRVWATILVGIIALYSVGYAAAALMQRKGWLDLVSRINVFMAIVLMVLAVLVNSPIIDPKLISANSQVKRLLSNLTDVEKFDYNYLRFSLGRYGNTELLKLASLEKHPHASEIKTHAKEALDKKSAYGPLVVADEIKSVEELRKRTIVYPKGRILGDDLAAYLFKHYKNPVYEVINSCYKTQPSCMMLAIDLNKDGKEEYVLFSNTYRVFSKTGSGWAVVGEIENKGNNWRVVQETLQREIQGAQVIQPEWQLLKIGPYEFTVVPRSIEGNNAGGDCE